MKESVNTSVSPHKFEPERDNSSAVRRSDIATYASADK